MNQTLKKILLIALFGMISYLAAIFIISTGMILIVLIIIGLSILGAYKLWEKFAKEELLKHEESFDRLKEEEKDKCTG